MCLRGAGHPAVGMTLQRLRGMGPLLEVGCSKGGRGLRVGIGCESAAVVLQRSLPGLCVICRNSYGRFSPLGV